MVLLPSYLNILFILLSGTGERVRRFEQDNYQPDASITDFLKDKGFALINKDDDVNLVLTKQVGANKNKLTILF